MRKLALKTPIYDAIKDGNVFEWILVASKDFRKIKQRERFTTLERLMDTHKDDNQRNKHVQP